MRREAEEHMYAMVLENTETFTKMAMESPIFAEHFALVDTPQEYYTIMSLNSCIVLIRLK